MSPKKIQFLAPAAIALQIAILTTGAAYGGIIIVADPEAQMLPIVINPAMRSIIFIAPPRDNPSLVRRNISRAHSWAEHKGRAPMAGVYYPYVYDPNDPPEVRTRAMVDYSLSRAHSYRRDDRR